MVLHSLGRATELMGLVILRMSIGIALRETAKVGELWRGKGRGSTRLEGAAHEQLGREEGSEVHVVPGSGGHVSGMAGGGSIYSRDISSTVVTSRETLIRGIGVVSAVGESGVAV